MVSFPRISNAVFSMTQERGKRTDTELDGFKPVACQRGPPTQKMLRNILFPPLAFNVPFSSWELAYRSSSSVGCRGLSDHETSDQTTQGRKW
jgi:hypothetical protein